MASLATIPTEVLWLVLSELDYASEVNAVAQSCRRLHEIANDYLYGHHARTYSPQGLHRVIEDGNVDAINKLFLAGVDFGDFYYLQASSSKTPLQLAAAKGQVTILDAVAQFFGPLAVTDWAEELGTDAIDNGHSAVFDFLMWLGVSLDVPNEFTGRTFLSLAAEKGQLQCLQLLFNTGCNINSYDVFRQTPLWWACKEGHLDVVKFLVETGADPELASTEGPFTAPIYCAALEGHRSVVEYLLDKGAHADLETTANIHALAMIAINEVAKKDMILPLLFDHVNVDIELAWCSDVTRYRLLMCAAACGYYEMIEKIMSKPCEEDEEEGSPEHWSALRIAASHGHTRIITRLAGDENIVECEAVIESAAYGGHADAVDCLLVGASPHLISQISPSAFSSALRYPSVSDYLLRRNVLRNFKTDEEIEFILEDAISSRNFLAIRRVLSWRRCKLWERVATLGNSDDDEYVRRFNIVEIAAIYGDLETFNFILDKPWKKPNPTDKRWRSVVYWAARHKRVEIMRIFLERGFGVNDFYGPGPREIAQLLLTTVVDRDQLLRGVDNIEQRKLEGVRLLVDWGADLNGVDWHGWTALGVATKNLDMKMVDELLRLGADPFAGNCFDTNAFYAAFVDNKSPVSLQLLETFIEEGKKRGHYPEFDTFFDMGHYAPRESEEKSEDVKTGHGVKDAKPWDPVPTDKGLSEAGWLKFQKMKRIRTLYWRFNCPAPGTAPKW